MKNLRLLLGATAALTLLSGCGATMQESAPPAPCGGVSVQDVAGVGKTLVDSSGKTLYFADQETGGMIKCTDNCLSFWFPVAGSASTAKSVDGLGVVKRPDNGQSQLTYQGKPLYTFKLDTGPGQHQGNDVQDAFGNTTFTWHAATTSATATAPTQAPANPGY
jgi:predicted lipoprotein with Yx(FWY)xxD motif